MSDYKTIETDTDSVNDGNGANTAIRDDDAGQDAAPVPTEDDDAQRDSAAHPS